MSWNTHIDMYICIQISFVFNCIYIFTAISNYVYINLFTYIQWRFKLLLVRTYKIEICMFFFFKIIYICICICIYVYVFVFTHIFRYTFTFIYIYMFTYMHIYIFVFIMCIYIYVYLYTLSIFINRNRSINMYIYNIYIWNQLSTFANDLMCTRRRKNPKQSCIVGKQMSGHVFDLRRSILGWTIRIDRWHSWAWWFVFLFQTFGHARADLLVIRGDPFDQGLRLRQHLIQTHFMYCYKKIPTCNTFSNPAFRFVLVGGSPHNVDAIKSHSNPSVMIFQLNVQLIN